VVKLFLPQLDFQIDLVLLVFLDLRIKVFQISLAGYLLILVLRFVLVHL
jgi:hypothetical protein